MTLALQILLDLVAGLAAPFQRGHRIADRALLHNLFQQVGYLRIMFFNRFASASSSTNSVPVPAQGSTAVKFLDPLENGGLRPPTPSSILWIPPRPSRNASRPTSQRR